MVTFPPDELDRTFAALAHPTRRALLARLTRGGGLSVTELAEPFDVSLMAISKHLKVMEEAGLVTREKDGRTHLCSLDPAPMDRAARWIDDHRRFWTDRLDALARLFEGQDPDPTTPETDP